MVVVLPRGSVSVSTSPLASVVSMVTPVSYTDTAEVAPGSPLLGWAPAMASIVSSGIKFSGSRITVAVTDGVNVVGWTSGDVSVTPKSANGP